MQKWITVKDMYEYAVDNNLYLLSQFNADFWSDYKTNHQAYDKLFKRYYKNFRYFDQDIFDDDLNVEEVTNNFIDEVYNHLMINKKKYDELYRIASINDSNYNFMENLDMTETITGSGTDNRTIVNGSRSDSTTHSETNVSGTRSDTTNDTEGARVDTSEEQVSAFNQSTYTNASKTTDNKGAETDTNTFNKGEQTDTKNYTDSLSKGEQTDTDNLISTDNRSIERKGLLSKDSKSDLIRKHLNLWDKYKFYEYIMNEIAKELLLV